jgi:hypothetical protein
MDHLTVFIGCVRDMIEGAGKQCRIRLGKSERQVNEPHIAGATGQIVAVPVRLQHFGVAVAIRVRRFTHPSPREGSRHIERPAFLNAEERAVFILGQRLCLREVEAACQVGIDACDGCVVQAGGLTAILAEANE